MHSLTCMSVVVCVVRKPRPCNSYSRRRDRINSVLWRSYYKGGGGTPAKPKPKPKTEVKVRIDNTKVPRMARAGQTFPQAVA